MNTPFAFVLGLLVGWLVEWLIDYFFWRRRRVERVAVLVEESHRDASDSPARALPVEPIPQAAEEKREEIRPQERVVAAPVRPVEPVVPVQPDNLQVIKGIGPVIERKLNEAGVLTFQQLSDLSHADLERILGSTIKRLANEDAILEQARALARRE